MSTDETNAMIALNLVAKMNKKENIIYMLLWYGVHGLSSRSRALLWKENCPEVAKYISRTLLGYDPQYENQEEPRAIALSVAFKYALNKSKQKAQFVLDEMTFCLYRALLEGMKHTGFAFQNLKVTFEAI